MNGTRHEITDEDHHDAKCTPDGKTLLQWLDQYPDDPRFKPIAEAKQIYGVRVFFTDEIGK